MNDFIKKLCIYFLAYLIGLFPSAAFALPEGGQITAGQGNIQQTSSNSMVINQSTDKMITNWQGFNIGSAESVQFNQPNSSSVALNRVIGQDPSQIMGVLSANGQVFLTNPSGVIFGKNARVNVGSLMATTLKISDYDFLSGNYYFSQDPNKPHASIINEGLINASSLSGGGFVGFLAPSVENRGTIIANLGSVALASGKSATLDFSGDGLINFSINSPSSKEDEEISSCADCAVSNSGLIKADGGQVYLSARAAGNIIHSVVNNTGIIRARTVVEKEGRIFLMGGEEGVVENSGTLDASGDNAGEKGGTVRMLGEKVGLFDNAKVDVSGDSGGGTALIGGDFQGKNPRIQNAVRTFVSEGSEINASANTAGDGGKVIVWADDTTRFNGSIRAQGGAQNGNGGFVEVSGKHNLIFNGEVDTTAVNGQTGSLLLDPDDIIIADGAVGAENAQVSSDGAIAFADGGVVTYTIAEQTLEGLSAATDIVLQANNSILLNDLTDNELTLNQTGLVDFLTGLGGFSMTTGDTINLTGGGSLNIDTIASSSGGTGNGPITVGSLTTTSAGGISLNGTTVTTNGAIASAGLLDISATGTIAVNGDIDSNGLATINADSDDNGSGNFELLDSLKTINTHNNNLKISAKDLVLWGSIDSGTAKTTILTSVSGNTIGLDGGAANASTASAICSGTCSMTISGTELVNIKAANLAIGDSTNGDIYVDGVTSANTDLIGTVALNATREGKTVNFKNTDSTFNGGLIANAEAGINITGVTLKTENGNMSFNADTDGDGGVFTLASSINTTNKNLSIRAHDVNLGGAVNVGTGTVSFLPSGSITMDLGKKDDGSHWGGTFWLDATEFARITAANFIMGNSNNMDIVVGNINATSNISGTVTLNATKPIGFIEFSDNVTFNNLVAHAGDHISINSGTTVTADNINLTATMIEKNGTLIHTNNCFLNGSSCTSGGGGTPPPDLDEDDIPIDVIISYAEGLTPEELALLEGELTPEELALLGDGRNEFNDFFGNRDIDAFEYKDIENEYTEFLGPNFDFDLAILESLFGGDVTAAAIQEFSDQADRARQAAITPDEFAENAIEGNCG